MHAQQAGVCQGLCFCCDWFIRLLHFLVCHWCTAPLQRCKITNTGRTQPKTGEGIYIGSAEDAYPAPGDRTNNVKVRAGVGPPLPLVVKGYEFWGAGGMLAPAKGCRVSGQHLAHGAAGHTGQHPARSLSGSSLSQMVLPFTDGAQPHWPRVEI